MRPMIEFFPKPRPKAGDLAKYRRRWWFVVDNTAPNGIARLLTDDDRIMTVSCSDILAIRRLGATTKL